MAKKKNNPALNGQAEGESGANSVESGKNLILVTKLKRKYHLLKDESLNFEDRDQLLNHVCTILGMNRPTLDAVLIDL